MSGLPAWLLNKCQCPAGTWRRHLMAFRDDCAAYGLCLRSSVFCLMAYGFGHHHVHDVRAHNEVRVRRPFDRSSDNSASSASHQLQWKFLQPDPCEIHKQTKMLKEVERSSSLSSCAHLTPISDQRLHASVSVLGMGTKYGDIVSISI